MTLAEVIHTKVGTKGQIVLGKNLRDRYHIKSGTIVKQIPTTRGIIIQTIDKQKIMQNIASLAKEVGKHWPKNLDCAELIRRERK